MELDKQKHFKPFIYGNQIYDLSHLDACIMEYIQPALKDHKAICYKFYITYSMHCFTKDYPEQTEEEKLALMYNTERESRPFCEERYKLSKHLPQIIQKLPESYIGFAGYDNFATIEMIDQQTKQAIFYKVTFVAYRFKRKLRLHITSAYPIPKREKLKPIGFFKIANNLLKNKSIPTPK
ncbi:stationary phase growth adaptation protein [Actinobacillus genomosp. 2]|uniref:stationary phase growth adaptation protein n=1 Tax=Actinobacillus genomosp. 2 TaxID=230709 RepID=UPI00244354C2|nr:stationary phase growth adaptation protein [Actinobacillus genomosp. 2]WGE31663.1 stationary phase growth adaptation protein [Actinobacillus genomosp. 2]